MKTKSTLKLFFASILMIALQSEAQAAWPIQSCSGSDGAYKVEVDFIGNYLQVDVLDSSSRFVGRQSYLVVKADYVRDNYVVHAQVGNGFTQMIGQQKTIDLSVNMTTKAGAIDYKVISDGVIRRSGRYNVKCR